MSILPTYYSRIETTKDLKYVNTPTHLTCSDLVFISRINLILWSNLNKDLIKIVNYSKSSYIVFYSKLSKYSHFTYCLQEELTQVSLFSLELVEQFGIENHKQKISNTHKGFLN